MEKIASQHMETRDQEEIHGGISVDLYLTIIISRNKGIKCNF